MVPTSSTWCCSHTPGNRVGFQPYQTRRTNLLTQGNRERVPRHGAPLTLLKTVQAEHRLVLGNRSRGPSSGAGAARSPTTPGTHDRCDEAPMTRREVVAPTCDGGGAPTCDGGGASHLPSARRSATLTRARQRPRTRRELTQMTSVVSAAVDPEAWRRSTPLRPGAVPP